MKMLKSYLHQILTVFLAVAIGFQTGCVSIGQSPVSGNKRVYGYSWEEEVKLGRQADEEIVAQYGVYDDQELSEYVMNLGQELLAVSHMRRENTDPKFKNTEFTFRVLNSPVVNAFALPGGYVYVTRGLMSHLQNEAQLAVVLGHEIGHVAARHASQRAAEQQFGQLAVIGGALIGESIGLDGGNILQLSSQTAQLLFLKYSRDDERESDELGVEYAAMENFVAAEGAEFFRSLERISEKQGVSIPSHLSTHPDPGEREERIPRLAQNWAEKGYNQNIIDREEYLNHISGMIFGDNPREGFEREGIFYHPDLAFQFPVPSLFDVYNQTNAVILVNESQDAILQFRIDGEHNDARASVEAFLNQEGITTISRNEDIQNTYNGYEAEATAQTQDGQEIKIQISALKYNGNVYQFLSYSTSAQFEQYETYFNQVFSGFQNLTDQSILNISPVRLQLVEADRRAPFSSFLPDNLPMDIEAEDIAIINQVTMEEVIEPGTILKIPVQ